MVLRLPRLARDWRLVRSLGRVAHHGSAEVRRPMIGELPVFFVQTPTVGGLLSMADRYADLGRFREWLERRERGEALGEPAPMPLSPLTFPSRYDRWDHVLQVIHAVCRVPWSSEATAAFVVRVQGNYSELRPMPAPSDLDSNGACPCGCGFGG